MPFAAQTLKISEGCLLRLLLIDEFGMNLYRCCHGASNALKLAFLTTNIILS